MVNSVLILYDLVAVFSKVDHCVLLNILLFLCEMVDGHCDNPFMIYVSQIIMLYILCLCQLHINETGIKNT